MKIVALCNTCNHFHNIDFDPAVGPGAAFSDWNVKHFEHDIDYYWPGRKRGNDQPADRTVGMIHNSDVKISYAASAAYTITLASLASSSTLLTGRESTAVSNASNKYVDYILGGKIQVHTVAPAANTTIQVIAIGAVNDTPTYPASITGSDAAYTFPNGDVKNSVSRYAASMNVANTADIVYWYGPVSLLSLFGQMPIAHNLVVTQNTGQILSATGGNHVLNYTGLFFTVI